jgi:hypothetical protein
MEETVNDTALSKSVVSCKDQPGASSQKWGTTGQEIPRMNTRI